MKGVAQRLMKQGIVSRLLEWKLKYRAALAEDAALQAQAREKKIISRVRGRFQNREIGGYVLNWRMNRSENARVQHAQGIMRRVAAKILSRNVLDSISTWKRSAFSYTVQSVTHFRGTPKLTGALFSCKERTKRSISMLLNSSR